MIDVEVTAKDIVSRWLKENNYDGLVSPYGECGCKLDDLAPCNESINECSAAYDMGPGETEYGWSNFRMALGKKPK